MADYAFGSNPPLGWKIVFGHLAIPDPEAGMN
jgi:hypothetical protein